MSSYESGVQLRKKTHFDSTETDKCGLGRYHGPTNGAMFYPRYLPRFNMALGQLLRELNMITLLSQFEEERIEINMINAMSDLELTRLGVTTIGDRHRLRENYCTRLYMDT